MTPIKQFTDSLQSRHNVSMTSSHINALRRYAKTVTRWDELQCGVEYPGKHMWTIAVERDDITGQWTKRTMGLDSYGIYQDIREPVTNPTIKALASAHQIAETYGLKLYHQTDPRGASLYLGSDDMTDTNYNTQGVHVPE